MDSFMLQNMAGNFGAILGDDIATDFAVTKLQQNRSVANLQGIDNKITVFAILQQICNNFCKTRVNLSFFPKKWGKHDELAATIQVENLEVF